MSSKGRRRFGAQKKAQIVRRHLADKVAVSDLADEFGVQPSQTHTWVKQLLDQAEKAFERSSGTRRTEQAKDGRIAQLEEKITTKNEVIAELMEANVREKKPLGDSKEMLGSPRHSRRNCRLHQVLDGSHGADGQAPARLAGVEYEQVSRLETPLWQGQRAQWPGAARLVAGGLGKNGHPRLPQLPSAGRLSPAGLYDA